jgi:hypothetical protein
MTLVAGMECGSSGTSFPSSSEPLSSPDMSAAAALLTAGFLSIFFKLSAQPPRLGSSPGSAEVQLAPTTTNRRRINGDRKEHIR